MLAPQIVLHTTRLSSALKGSQRKPQAGFATRRGQRLIQAHGL